VVAPAAVSLGSRSGPSSQSDHKHRQPDEPQRQGQPRESLCCSIHILRTFAALLDLSLVPAGARAPSAASERPPIPRGLRFLPVAAIRSLPGHLAAQSEQTG